MGVILAILFVYQIIDSAGDTSSLVGRQHKDLRYLSAVFIEAKMSLVNGKEGHDLRGRLLIDKKVVPERTRLDNNCTFDKEWEECLHVEVLLVESRVRQSKSVHHLILSIVALVFASRKSIVFLR